MKRPSYREAINWVAQNDSDGCDDRLDTDAAGSLCTAVLLADIFDVSSDKVGADIVKRRRSLDSLREIRSSVNGLPALTKESGNG